MKKALFTVMLAAFMLPSFACTTFASAQAAGNAVMITKNRDEHPDLQSIVAFHPAAGYSFLAMASQQKPGSVYVVRSGINQYGLSIVNMGTPYIPEGGKLDNRYDDGDDFMQDILKHDKTIGEVMAHLPKLVAEHSYPESYLLADHQQTALIEIAPDDQYYVTISNSQPLYHANNYEAPGFGQYNTFYSESSINRYNRISSLMNSNTNYTLDTFKTFAEDHTAGSNDSIFRTGMDPTDPNTPRTLATFIAYIPKDQKMAPTVFIQFYPTPTISDYTNAHTYVLTPDFWNFVGPQKVLAVEQQS